MACCWPGIPDAEVPLDHDGQVATLRSNIRWCSGGLEFACWNGEVVRLAFALDCHDREVISLVATTAGVSGEMIRDMMVDCVEPLRRDPRAASRAVALRQRIDLRRPQDDSDRLGAESRTVLNPVLTHPQKPSDYACDFDQHALVLTRKLSLLHVCWSASIQL